MLYIIGMFLVFLVSKINHVINLSFTNYNHDSYESMELIYKKYYDLYVIQTWKVKSGRISFIS